MSQQSSARQRASGELIEALAGWQVLVAQFNDLVARKIGVTPAETQCMYVLERFGPSTPGELARRVNLSTGATTRMLDRLQNAGYITRSPDSHDRRKVVIEPAGDGVARIAALYGPLNEDLVGLLDDFDLHQLGHVTQFARSAEEVTSEHIRRI